MVVLLLMLGCFAVAAAMFLLGLGIPVKDTPFGAAVLVSASVAATGGVILVGFAAAISELRRALQAAVTRTMRPERLEAERGPGVRRMEPRLAPNASVGAFGGGVPGGVAGAGPLGGGVLGGAALSAASGPDVANVIPTKFDAPEITERPRRPAPEERSPPAAEKGWPPPPFASEPEAEPRRTPATPERFDTIRPSEYRKPDQHQQELQQRPETPPVAGADPGDVKTPQPSPGEAAGPGAIRPVRILKSGVINDVAYTLFSDGSIETQTPDGTLRFGSIDDFRKHLENSP